jgi:hypothetical protein
VQFDLEQLRSAMQAVEDFVLQKANEKPANDIGPLDANDLPSQPFVGDIGSTMPETYADQGSNARPPD